MTIDEAITKYNKLANNDRTCYPEEAQQLAEWLEELKAYRECNVCEYNKAIDDFAKFANTMPTIKAEDGTIRPMWLEEMAEQLKAGMKNE